MEACITRENADAVFAKAGLNLDEMYEKAKQKGLLIGGNKGRKRQADHFTH